MPCKGVDQELETNIEGALRQAYGHYRMVVVTDSLEDPAHKLAENVLSRHSETDHRLYTADAFGRASGKVAALLTALEKESGWAEVFAFIDSDALVPSRWLADLIQPLRDGTVGAATGFRWYFPAKTGFWSYVQTAWNSSGTNLLFDKRYNFPWGGAMAVRKETLEKIQIQQIWANAVSDDLTLNAALRKYGYRVTFVPQCTVASIAHANRQSFLEWAVRQITLARVLNRSVWKYALAAYGFFNVVFLLALISLALYLVLGTMWLPPLILLFTPSIFGILRSFQRNSTFSKALPEFRTEFRRSRFGEAITSLIVPWIMIYGIARSARANVIKWRGRNYKLQ